MATSGSDAPRSKPDHDRALIARNLTLPMSHYLNRALENGVKPSEISEAITHLAFYAGWANAFRASSSIEDIRFSLKSSSPMLTYD
jgi:alkylhydroperoxidase/carboxymuconolactone decarboxylase family protein YurZ